MKVQISRIESIQYDKTSKTLNVGYHDRICSYYHVPLFSYHQVLMSEQPHSYIRQYIHPHFHREESLKS